MAVLRFSRSLNHRQRRGDGGRGPARALVARPVEESLLGMSFLERLKSYAVERGRLILTAR